MGRATVPGHRETEMRGISRLAGASLAALTIGIAAAPVAGAADKVKPKLECVFEVPDKADTYIAVWGYENTATTPVEIPIGTDNRFDPAPEGRGQPTRFAVGRQTNVFTVTWNGTNLSWRLDGTSNVTASRNSKKCDSPPVPQGTDSPQSLALIAAAAGVIVVGGATSGWMVRRRRHRTA
jgi:hypothetical protein